MAKSDPARLIVLGTEVVVEVVLVVAAVIGMDIGATDMIVMEVIEVDVTEATEAIVIQMTGRSAVKMIVPMASEMIEIVAITRVDVDEVEAVKIEDLATMTETMSVRIVKRRKSMTTSFRNCIQPLTLQQ